MAQVRPRQTMEKPMGGILLATTGSAKCRRAESYALDYCQRNNTLLTVIHVVEPGLAHYGEVDTLATEGDRSDFINHVRRQELSEAQRCLTRLTEEADSRNIHYRLYIEWKSPLYCIVKQIRLTAPELLVVGGRRSRRNPFCLVRCLNRKAACAVRQVT
jgi:nucleotide-binding universal stress UspA family protein